MGCSSSSQVQNPSKKHPIKDESISYQRQRSANPSTSTISHSKDSSLPKTSVPDQNIYCKARYAYPPTEGGKVEKGDILKLGEKGKRDRYWCGAFTNTGEQVFVPNSYLASPGSLQCHDWYHESLSKYEAERKLSQEGLEPGTFLIHKKPHNSDYICSALTDKGVSHYVIRSEKGGYFITRRRVFISVEVLVEVFMSEEKDIPFRLANPLACVPPILYSRYEGEEYPLVIPSDSVQLGKKLGEGGDSVVWEGMFNGNQVTVRTFKSEKLSAEKFRDSFLRLKSIYHKNLQLVLGMCCQEDNLFLVAEHFNRGSLSEYLKKEGEYLTESELIHIAAQISTGMSYLEMNDYTHGLLAAHNVMLGSDDLLKICDVGTRECVGTRDSYVRWTPMEVFIDQKNLSIKSDVWSFGMVMMEIVTLGKEPFSDLQDSEVETQVCEGYQMPKPAECHAYLYDLMHECWNYKPVERPTFDSLTYRLDDFYISAEHEISPRQSIYRYVK